MQKADADQTLLLQDPPETITVDGEVYPIPAPWSGNKITPPTIANEEFRLIPTEHAKDNTRLYIVKDAQAALVKMMEAALEEGILLQVESGYRSLRYQKKIFSRMLAEGRTFDDIIRYVAPPGYSQHATGTAVDFSPSNWNFAELPAYSWLKEHAAEFGFTETYPENNPLAYPWEAWHWNYRSPH